MNAARELAQVALQMADLEATQLLLTWRLAITVRGVTASAGALLAAGGASLADKASNHASLGVAAIPVSANAVHIDTAAPIVRNAAVLDGQASLDVTSDLVLDFGTTLGAGVADSIRLVNDANTASKSGFYGETTDHTLVMYFGGRVSSNGITTVQTYSSATTQNASTLSGSVSIVNATGVVTINLLHDLDLANNYHLEVAANSFTNTANGLSNAAFATVSLGAGGSSSAAVAMTGASALTAAHTWINITGLEELTGGIVASAAGPTAYVIANQNANPLETVILADTTNVSLAGFRAGDMLYIDNTFDGRTSRLVSASEDVSWTANATNDSIWLDLAAQPSFAAYIALPVAAFTDVNAMNLRINNLGGQPPNHRRLNPAMPMSRYDASAAVHNRGELRLPTAVAEQKLIHDPLLGASLAKNWTGMCVSGPGAKAFLFRDQEGQKLGFTH